MDGEAVVRIGGGYGALMLLVQALGFDVDGYCRQLETKGSAILDDIRKLRAGA